jgi:transposase
MVGFDMTIKQGETMILSNEQKAMANKLRHNSGHYSSRMCFSCNKGKSQMGGGIDKKTRQWVCVECKK